MCGIAGVHRRNGKPFPKLGKFVNELLLGIEDRGRDSTGLLAMMPDGRVQMDKGVVTASRFIRKRAAFSDKAMTVILHTRWATVGRVNHVNAHPVINDRLAAVHNGTIRNATALFKTFGLTRHAEVDSEIIPALVAHAGWENASEALALMEGGAATAIVNADRPGEVILARLRTYPLVYFLTEDFIVWASTERAIVEAWHMTFRRRPPKGEWGRLGEGAMLRVNGEVEREWIDLPKVPELPLPKSRRAKKRSGTASTATTARKRRKHAKRGTPAKGTERPREATRPAPPTPGMPVAQKAAQGLEGMDEMVRTLMRTQGYEFTDAYTIVHGTDLDVDLDAWRETLWQEMDDELSRLLMEERS